MTEPIGRGVLGPPVKPGDDSGVWDSNSRYRPEVAGYAFFFTSLTVENSMPSARSLV